MKYCSRIMCFLISLIIILTQGVVLANEETSYCSLNVIGLNDIAANETYELPIELKGLEEIKGAFKIKISLFDFVTVNNVSINGTNLERYDSYNINSNNQLVIVGTFNHDDDFQFGQMAAFTIDIDIGDVATGIYPVSVSTDTMITDDNQKIVTCTYNNGSVFINNDLTESALGDINCDGHIDATDITILRRYLLNQDSQMLSYNSADVHADLKIDIIDMVASKKLLSNVLNYKYYFCGKQYSYAITADGKEMIYYRTGCNDIEALKGGGVFSLKDSNGSAVMEYGNVKNFEEGKDADGNTIITVSYNITGNSLADTPVGQTVYTFNNKSLTVTPSLKINCNNGVASGYFLRKFVDCIGETNKKINYKWIYPENGDYPYPVFESFVTENFIRENVKIYTFNRDEKQNTAPYIKSYPQQSLPINFTSDNAFDYSFKYDLVFENTEETNDCDFNALFCGQNSNLGVKISPLFSNDDNSTVFTGDNIALNLKLSNFTKTPDCYDLSYNIMNYYGEKIEEEHVKDIRLAGNSQKNKIINVTGGYGIYYLNLSFKNGDNEYTECYPFMLAEGYNYKYLTSSNFGIAAVHRNNTNEENTSINLLKKLGIYHTRLSKGDSDFIFAQKLNQVGLKCYTQYVGTLSKQSELDNLLSLWNKWKPYADWFTINNEFDTNVKGNLEKCRTKMENEFLPNYFTNAKDFVLNNNIPLTYVASCHGNSEWQQVMHEYGVWDASEIIDTHLYSHPKSPDKYKITTNTMYSIEYGLQRMKDAISEYGKSVGATYKNSGEKLYVIGETGYPTNPTDKTTVDLRTQADFNTRIGVLGLAYGADLISFYEFYDRTSYYTGTKVNDNEMNFGAFYNYDYYGVTKPKPWAAAYSNMTKRLDGVESVTINSTYDKDKVGTVRAFTVNNKSKDKMIVAWSNIYTLPNTTSKGVSENKPRNPTLPWESQWQSIENVEFDAVKDTVTVIDTMGNSKQFISKDGKVTIPLTGSPVYIYGVQ